MWQNRYTNCGKGPATWELISHITSLAIWGFTALELWRNETINLFNQMLVYVPHTQGITEGIRQKQCLSVPSTVAANISTKDSHVPGVGWSHLMHPTDNPTKDAQDDYHFTDAEWSTEGWSDLPGVTQLLSDKSRIWNQTSECEPLATVLYWPKATGGDTH